VFGDVKEEIMKYCTSYVYLNSHVQHNAVVQYDVPTVVSTTVPCSPIPPHLAVSCVGPIASGSTSVLSEGTFNTAASQLDSPFEGVEESKKAAVRNVQ
jgi:hypothetical protein